VLNDRHFINTPDSACRLTGLNSGSPIHIAASVLSEVAPGAPLIGVTDDQGVAAFIAMGSAYRMRIDHSELGPAGRFM
jgi:hypothetical protein